MRFVEHPQRQHVVGEMHLRRFPRLSPPAQVVQLVRMLDEQERDAEREALTHCPCPLSVVTPRHVEGRWSETVRMTWERLSEASTVTLIGTEPSWHPLSWVPPLGAERAQALAWVEALPGRVIRATHLFIVDDEDAAGPLVDQADFSASHLVSCHLAGGARLWSDFRINADGYGRVIIAANGLAPADLARTVQRLQELGNYRNMALTGLPVAQAGWAQLEAIARSLEQTGRSLHQGGGRDDDLLSALSSQSAALLSIASECDFRMSATAAYAQIVAERLAELDVRPVAGFQSLTDFTGRRFNPAMRTCNAFTARLTLLSGRAAQFTALLRTRIETHIENQNGRLLASVDAGVRMQLRLQHLVEGLSVVAISYYALGLLAYPMKAVEKLAPAFSSTLVLGVAAPLIALTVWATMGRLRRRLISSDDKPATEGA